MSTSRHLVLDLLAIRNMPSRASGSNQAAAHSFAVGTSIPESLQVSAEAFPADGAAGCPACAGKHRPHTSGKQKRPANGEESKKKAPKKEEEKEQPSGSARVDKGSTQENVGAKKPAQAPRGDIDAAIPGTGLAVSKTEDEKDLFPPETEGAEEQEPQPAEDLGQPQAQEVQPPGPGPEPQNQDPVGALATSLARLCRRLDNDVELLKLRVKHYHMSPSQFRRRTSALKIPETIYEKFTKIC